MNFTVKLFKAFRSNTYEIALCAKKVAQLRGFLFVTQLEYKAQYQHLQILFDYPEQKALPHLMDFDLCN